MNKVVISVLGTDRPGIVATVSRVLFEHDCNIEDVSQTILQSEFGGIFITTVPPQLSLDSVQHRLQEALREMNLSVLVKPLETRRETTPPPSEPFVVTTIGPDRLGLVARITEVMARFNVNITYLKAVFRGGDDPHQNVMIYEVDVPLDMDQQEFRRALRERAQELGLELSLQHRRVFEAIHRI